MWHFLVHVSTFIRFSCFLFGAKEDEKESSNQGQAGDENYIPN